MSRLPDEAVEAMEAMAPKDADTCPPISDVKAAVSRFPAAQLVFPVQGFWCLAGQGHRFGAPRGPRGIHLGQDIMADEGTMVVTPVDGSVFRRVEWDGKTQGFGNTLVIEGDDGWFYVFAHLQSMGERAQEGVWYAAGRRLGRLGRSGGWWAPHLHFEVWTGPPRERGSRAVDPLPALARWSEYPEVA